MNNKETVSLSREESIAWAHKIKEEIICALYNSNARNLGRDFYLKSKDISMEIYEELFTMKGEERIAFVREQLEDGFDDMIQNILHLLRGPSELMDELSVTYYVEYIWQGILEE